MAIEVNGRRFVTLADEFFVGGSKVYAAYANGVQVYPDSSRYPTYIRITTPPNRTTYLNNEDIDFTGMVVTAFCEDGSVWDDVYSGGIIPHSDLIFPKTKAVSLLPDYDGTSLVEISAIGSAMDAVYRALSMIRGGYVEHGDVLGEIRDFVSQYEDTYPAQVKCSLYDNNPIPGWHGWGSFVINFAKWASAGGQVTNATVGNPCQLGGFPPPSGPFLSIQTMWDNNGSTLHLYDGDTPGQTAWFETIFVGEYTDVDTNSAMVHISTLIPGEYDDGTTIPVQWIRPHDQSILEDSFEISIEYGSTSGGGDF